jgi:hypothetical protein
MVRFWLALSLSVLVPLAAGRADAAPAAIAEADAAPAHHAGAGKVQGDDEPAGKGDKPNGAAGDGAADPEVVAGVPMVDAAVQDARPARYGLGVRSRWASTPSWLLGLFTQKNKPLNSYAIGGEFFRRSGNFDFLVGLTWQDLSPSDGNWLGKGNNPATDTDFVQFRNFGAVSLDAAFILRTDFNPYVGLHYGGGIGLGIITGQLLRTSDGSAGCATNPGSVANCYPIIPGCTGGPCTEQQLQASQGTTDSPGRGSRFADGHVPTVYPIVNVVVGLDFRIPNADGLEFKIEGGFFFPYLFLGGGAGYRF